MWRAGSTVSSTERSRNAAAAARPPRAWARSGRALELRRDLLVRAGRGLGPVPGPPIGIDRRVGDLGQRRVQLPPVGDDADQ